MYMKLHKYDIFIEFVIIVKDMLGQLLNIM